MRAAKVQASLHIRAASPEPPLLAHTSSESWGTFRQKARSRAPLNGWACVVKICHDGMLDHTNSLDAPQFPKRYRKVYLSTHVIARVGFFDLTLQQNLPLSYKIISDQHKLFDIIILQEMTHLWLFPRGIERWIWNTLNWDWRILTSDITTKHTLQGWRYIYLMSTVTACSR